MKLALRVAISVCAVTVGALSKGLPLALSLVGLVAVFVALQGFRVTTLLAWSVAAIALPLVIVHGFINPAFGLEPALDGMWFWRPGGIAYALQLGARLTLLFLAVAIWFGVPRLTLVSLLVRSRAPLPAGMLLMQAASQAEMLRLQVPGIYRSAESRGAMGKGRLRDRARAMVPLTVPTVAISITSAVERGGARERLHGVPPAQMQAPVPLPRPSSAELLASAALTLGAFAMVGWTWWAS